MTAPNGHPLTYDRRTVLVGMAGRCGVILGCVPCQLPKGHAGKHDPAPEPPVATDDPDWAIQTPTRKDI